MNNHSESSLGTTGEEDPTPQEAPDRGGPTLDENFPVTTTEDAPAEERGEPTLQQNDDPELPRWFPRGCRTKEPVYYGNQEALGWALDTVGRSVAFIGAGSFLGTALLKLAKEAAGCETEPPPGSHKVPDCNERVYGIRPSSLLTTYTIVVGVVSAALLPLMGAVVDYTPHRRKAGRWFSFMFCIILFPQIFLNENTWFAVAILQMILAFIGWAQTMVTFAYLPELSDSEQRLNEYTQSFTIVGFGSMVIYLMCIIGVAFAAGISDNDVATAQLGTSVSFVVSCVTLYVSWGKLMLKRPAARTLPEGRTLWTAGFIQVYHTSIHICKHFPALKWFYVSIMFIDSAIKYVRWRLLCCCSTLPSSIIVLDLAVLLPP
jgi:MFS-type transporter involved in bile tolerance (Atg22 family)